MRTFIQTQSPTVEDKTSIIDATDTSTPGEKKQETLTTTKPPSPIKRFVHDRLTEIIIIGIAIPLLGFFYHQMYSLNREVGELRSDTSNTKSAQSKLETKIDEALKRLEARIDTLFDQQSHSQPQHNARH